MEAYLEFLNEIDYKTLMEAPMFKSQIERYNQSGVMDIVAEMLRQGKDEDLKELWRILRIWNIYRESPLFDW